MRANAEPPPEQPHVLVVDDDRRLRALLRRFLAEHGFLVTTAKDAADARAKLRSLRFDVLVLDVMMPGENGFDFTRSLRAESDVPILLLTAMAEVEDRIVGLEHGADDYLPKPFEPRELVLRLRAILRRARQAEAAAKIVRFGAFAFDLARAELRCGERPVSLTAGEAGLLRALAQSPGETVSRLDLGAHPDVGGRAVDVQIARLRRKIEENPKDPRYLVTVRGAGYALRPG